MKKLVIKILFLTAFAVSACSSGANETADSVGGKTEKANSVNTEVKQVETNKSTEISKNANADLKTTKSKETTKCELTKMPPVRGFSLGQTVDEINVKYPFFKKSYEAEKNNQLPDREKANFVLMTLGSSFEVEETKDIADFDNVNLIWHFLDEKLMALVVNYRDDATLKIEKIKPLIEKISKDYDIPKDGWKFGAEEEATLNCQGFRVDASNYYQNGPSLMITDLNLELESKKRGL